MNQEPELYVVCMIFGEGGIENFFFFFFLFFFISSTFLERLVWYDESDGLRRVVYDRGGWEGGGRWRARNMRHSNRWNALGLHFPRVWQWQPVESSRNARVPRPRLSSKTNFLARARASLPVNLNVFCLLNFDCDYRVHNLKIRMDD